MLVAMVSLAVSTVGGLLERRRSLTTLRLGGMEPGQLKRLVLVESLIPLVVTSLVAAGVGVGIGYVFMDMVSVSLDAKLSPMYLAVVAGSLVAATSTMYLTLPMIQKITSTEANRTE
jgi:ABC-type antimicrobial peptide transport system permease subunit